MSSLCPHHLQSNLGGATKYLQPDIVNPLPRRHPLFPCHIGMFDVLHVRMAHRHANLGGLGEIVRFAILNFLIKLSHANGFFQLGNRHG